MIDTVWIFGYGSLVWRPAFPYVASHPAQVRGWTRRFWQGSRDHRGVPERPGRVVTLLPERGATCWGRAYQVSPEQSGQVLHQLDTREQEGYERREVELHLTNGVQVPGLMYLATPDNPSYLGPAPLPEIARSVRRCAGLSGPNLEYVLRLAQSLREMRADDPHVFALEALLSTERA